ncbi:MAG: primosomal protein N' [Clostridiales bacterium]|nr:primosomal protein N' [Clostridiales bacterium]
MKYVELVIANNSDKTDRYYTYGCPFDNVSVGQKVVAPFSLGNRLKDAYVFEVRSELGEEVKGLKYVESMDEQICLTEEAVKTCIWMKKRYACRYIDAVNCFTPVGTGAKSGKKRNPYKGAAGEIQDIKALTSEQADAVDRISCCVRERSHSIFLLHGVTGSGKTEVYIQTISQCMESGRAAIMLVPEISLTTQIIDRFIGRFGSECIAVLHSRLSYGERHDEWVRIRSGQVKIVIGARSAVFAPLEDIGAIILDEEHEPTYKSDKTPKYDTVEIAIKRVKSQNKGKGIVILGSATPSVVSSYRADEGIYERLSLKKRFNETALPQAEIADMRTEITKGNKSVFSRRLYSETQRCLSEGLQVILFLNRRGYSTFVSCRECGHVMKCQGCGISLTYHKSRGSLVCHYCGHEEKMPETCPACSSKHIKDFGAGTEKVEEEAKALFPGVATGRLDLDAIKRKGDTEKVLGSFKAGRTRILIGTQLVAKGLDFDNVGLVGIISADTTLNIPDFRSTERTFQLITQAAGRAGRRDKAGKVVIQTYTPGHYAVAAASAHDYDEFYRAEINLRKLLKYPPFSDLIQVVFTAESEEEARQWAEKAFERLVGELPKESGQDMFPPQELPFFKQDGSRYQILIKSGKGKRNLYMDALALVKKGMSDDKACNCNMGIDVNPYSFL